MRLYGLTRRVCLVLAVAGALSLIAGFAILVTISVPGLPGAGTRVAATGWGLLAAGFVCGSLLVLAGTAHR